jgi:hypothetical protein
VAGAVLRGGTPPPAPADAYDGDEGDADGQAEFHELRQGPVSDVAAALLEEARKRGETELGQSRVYRDFIDSIKAQHPNGPIVFVVGAAWMGGHVHGARTPGIRLLLRLLEDEFLVIYCNEDYTSRLCPECLSRSDFVRDRDYRSKYCTNPACHGSPAPDGAARRFVFHRDIAAPVLFRIGLRFELEHQGQRALAFERPTQKRVVQHPL